MLIPIHYVAVEAAIEVYVNYRCASCRRFNCICDDEYMDWYESEGH